MECTETNIEYYDLKEMLLEAVQFGTDQQKKYSYVSKYAVEEFLKKVYSGEVCMKYWFYSAILLLISVITVQ